MKRALLFDLDDTLVVGNPAAAAAFLQPLKSRSPATLCRPTGWRWWHAIKPEP
jgi:FMN phosphatase YigB (HAD superfamily)